MYMHVQTVNIVLKPVIIKNFSACDMRVESRCYCTTKSSVCNGLLVLPTLVSGATNAYYRYKSHFKSSVGIGLLVLPTLVSGATNAYYYWYKSHFKLKQPQIFSHGSQMLCDTN